MYSRATCANIGGTYGYAAGGQHYRSDSGGRGLEMGRLPMGRQYYCLFDTFNCAA